MLALDTGDAIRGYASTANVVDYTIHGFVGTSISQLADGQLADAEGDLFSATSATAIAAIILVNTSSSNVTVNLFLRPSGGTSRRIVPKDVLLQPGYSLHFEGGKIKVLNTNGEIVVTTSASSFVGLTDTPSSYSGQSGKMVKVKSTEDGVEFSSQIGGAVIGDEYDNGNSGASFTIDWQVRRNQKLTLTDNCSLSFTDPAGPCNLILKLVQDGTGGRTVTWPTSVKWPDGGTAPTLSSSANAVDIITFYFDGTNYYGNYSLNFT